LPVWLHFSSGLSGSRSRKGKCLLLRSAVVIISEIPGIYVSGNAISC
jgi:hypothetical protein